MRGRVAEVAAVFGVAAIVTVAMAVPVLRAPDERVFGREIVGRHRDPFNVMAQFGLPVTIGVYSQPVTDIPGAFLARLTGPVAAYNWLVLLSFPLSAAAAYLLARHLALAPAGATVAALAYAFSPFHLSHAAYHPHIAQTQWLPLYLLALWRCLDTASPLRIGALGAATLAVSLSNFYGGLIAAVITPVAVAGYWVVTRRADPHSIRHVGITVASLALFAAAGMTYAWYAAREVVVNRAAFAFPRGDLFRYSAKWWSYLVPPVEHPLLGSIASRVWNAAGVREGLLEQQVSLGWGIVSLALIAVVCWLRGDRQAASFGRVPLLVVIGATALICSLSPERTIGTFTFVRPSALLYEVVPMFRAYARFGGVVQLMAALLAGIGVDYLRRPRLATQNAARRRIVCFVLVALAAGEYTVAPSQVWRDVLPTAAHRWVVQQPGDVRALDCVPLNPESESVRWLTGYRVNLLSAGTSDCMEPSLSEKLAAMRYTHLLVRRDTAEGRWFAARPVPEQLRVAASFDDGQVFAVTARPPGVYTAAMTGFGPREHDAEWSWRWMEAVGGWRVVNTSPGPIITTLGLELSAFHRPRRMELLLDGRWVQTLEVDPARRTYQIGPLNVPAGDHELVFRPADVPTAAGDVINNRDRRRLSFAFGTWTWSTWAEQH